MKKIILFVLIILVNSTVSFSQTKFYFFTDYSVFKNTGTKSTVELYFSVNQRDLHYVKGENNFVGQANIEVSIFDKNKNIVVFDDFYGLQSKVNDTNKSNLNNKLIGQQNFTLSNGEYLFKLIGSDFNNRENCDTLYLDIKANAFDSTKTEMSDIQVASFIEKTDDKKSIFYKNGLEVTPNPDALFGMNLKTVYYYIEIYSIGKNFSGDKISFVTSISDLSNNIIKQNSKIEKRTSNAFIEIGNIDVDSLEKGTYLLTVKLLDESSGLSIEKEKKFFVYNKTKNGVSEQSDDKNYLKSEYQTMTDEKINDEFEKSTYIRTSSETSEFKKLKSLDEKRKYMYFFWKKRNPNLLSLVNDYKIQYFKNIDEANNLYKQGFMDGWKTDRGRIYVTYGRPSEVENHTNEAESKGYEIWTFESVQGGAICVFAERELGSGLYYLIHSTIRGEFRDDDWKTKIKK
jgi:GWxTD domain-containing protein